MRGAQVHGQEARASNEGQTKVCEDFTLRELSFEALQEAEAGVRWDNALRATRVQ